MAKSSLVALIAVASLLATGCYCPMLSGRYGDLGCYPPCPMPPPQTAPATDDSASSAADVPCAAHGCCLLNGLFGRGRDQGGLGLGLANSDNRVPSQQGPDYLSPQPKFHPVPTHPTFEPQLAYAPPVLIETAGNPLRPARSTGSGIFGGGVFIAGSPRFSTISSRPSPAQEPPAVPTPPPDR